MKRIRETMSCEKGFTLVELLVVIGIIGILAMMLLPQFRGMRDRARIASCESNLKNVGTTLEAFYADNERYPKDDEWKTIQTDLADLAACPQDTTTHKYEYVGDSTVTASATTNDTMFKGTTPTGNRIDTFVVYCPFHTGASTDKASPALTQLFVTERGVERFQRTVSTPAP